MVEVVSEEYKKAWKGVYPLELVYQRSEMQPQFANIATPSEIVVSTSFTLEIGDLTGSLHLCIPYSTLEPIRDILYSTSQGDSMEMDRRWVRLLSHEIQSAEVEITAELASTRTTIEQLLAMKVGDFIELERERVIQAKVDGVPVIEAEYGTHNGKYALKVQRLLRERDAVWHGEHYDK
jgi:flagellar motor switch protein FliM